MTDPPAASKVLLPPGVKIGAGRETTESDPQGQIVQGVKFPLTTANGTSLSVFVPYSDIHDTAKVQTIIERRVAGILAITG